MPRILGILTKISGDILGGYWLGNRYIPIDADQPSPVAGFGRVNLANSLYLANSVIDRSIDH